jgi:hypothetical protein
MSPMSPFMMNVLLLLFMLFAAHFNNRILENFYWHKFFKKILKLYFNKLFGYNLSNTTNCIKYLIK